VVAMAGDQMSEGVFLPLIVRHWLLH